MMELEDLVRSHGETSFRRSCCFHVKELGNMMLTDEQSDHL